MNTMRTKLTQALDLADQGDVDGALAILKGLLSENAQVDEQTRAAAFELQGRCQLGVLANIQSTASFEEAARCYEHCERQPEAAYCRLLRVRKLLDDRLLREARNQLTPTLRDAISNHWSDVLSLGLEFLGLLCFHTKELRKASGLLEEALLQGDTRKLSWERLLVKLSLANCYTALGDNPAAAKLMAEITSDPRHQRIPRVAAYVLMNQGYDAYLTGDTRLARQHFQQVVRIASAELRSPNGLAWLSRMASYNLGLIAIEDGEYEQARQMLLEVVQVTSEHGYYQLLCGSLTSLCVVELLLDDLDAAKRHAAMCQTYVNQFGDIETRLADYFLALVHLALGQLDQAQLLWLYKPVLEDNSETQVHYNWMRRVLEHLLECGAQPPFNLGHDALALARRWLAALQ
jgi:tetratricopeptide (TPR) repeat protein